MEAFAVDSVTQLPRLDSNEVVLQSWKGRVMVTSHRVLILDHGKQLSLSKVKSVVLSKTSRMWSQKPGRVELWDDETMLVSVKDGGEELKKCCEQALRDYQSKQNKPAAGFSSSSAGVGGILRKERRKRAEAGLLAGEVQSDLNALIEKAATVADVLKRYSAKDDKPEAMMRSLGVFSGGIYTVDGDQEALARKIAALTVSVYFPWIADDDDDREDGYRRAAAAVSLPDIYCQFNRARGLSLVSPEDFVSAIEVYLNKDSKHCLRDMPVEFRMFPATGVKVLTPAKRPDEALYKKLSKLAGDEEHRGISEIRAAAHLKIPANLARLHLIEAEIHGHLCRDESPAGLRFYPNLFLSSTA